ncbi:sugar/nucleoside kinase (ribokinase family) [Palleronia aestuarii]|uniref:Sugar/nucleoside kinase (Ribokinase family) n=1 Tax=Palleronia aestuarii TaxID=568105 RepID=A0A2W7Q9U9_9RHOB|nr:PfkB family carbohydrate kinase [Palleronia aestuarii]PZX18509.1 sugar/nucleoside kinase (ribokinase family) [Palleronia aestuarii]
MRSDPILCIGSVLWDVIGRSASAMRLGNDVPGRIAQVPGGVAMNIAMALARLGLQPRLLTSIGRDAEGDLLVAAAERLGIDTSLAYRSDDLPTDRYMAIEGANGLIAAIADAHSLEVAGERILEPLSDGRLSRPDAPYRGTVALDGNLSEPLLAQIATGALLAEADLRVAPASPGKALRLKPFLGHAKAVIYVNLEEATLLLGLPQDDSMTAADAARMLVAHGAARAVVTDGGREAAVADASDVLTAMPPRVLIARVTGAGDTFMAAHIAAETRNDAPRQALEYALATAAAYVSGDVGS